MGTMHNHQGTLGLFLPPNVKEEKVIERFHGIDRHKKFSTISVTNREGQEIQFLSTCWDLRRYNEDLGPEDAVILEASSGAFWWMDRIEAKGAACYILDPHRFRIIKGITSLTALAFLADVGDVTRFKSLRKMNAYLGLVPRVNESAG
jgi:transposase